MAGRQILPRMRGVQSSQEAREEFLFRDTRSTLVKFVDWMRSPQNMMILLGGHLVLTFIVPASAFYVLLSATGFFAWAMRRSEEAALKLPIQSGILDPKELNPANRNPMKAGGIFYLGNDIASGKELWLTNSDARQHLLVLGTTGSGKTELLLGFAANALSWGSGFLFCDGKGDVSLFAKTYAMARLFGREDDILVLNFMTGNADIGQEAKKRSNTLNPFSTGSSDSLTQMMVSLMDDTGGDGAMWKGRATAMFTGVMRALIWLRDEGRVDLNIGLIRDFLGLNKIIELATSDTYSGMPQHIRNSVLSYLTSLPGFKIEGGMKQAQSTLDQHGYLEMQFTKILGSLADVYGHIFMTPNGEVDMYDVVVNRRILVVMLPALEKSPDELANIGKIIIATLKGMMGQTLGSEIDGSWQDVVDRRPTSSPSPFVTILDEAGYYIGDGTALMTAQARSLGFSLTIATQDLPSLERRNEKEAKSIIANTNTKIFMRTEEPESTGRLAVAIGGRAKVARAERFAGNAGSMDMAYRDTMDARVEEVDRVSGTDLRGMISGEMTVFHQDHKINARSFYAAPDSAVDRSKMLLRTNYMIPVPKPTPDQLERVRLEPNIMKQLIDPAFADQMVADANQAELDVATKTDSLSVAMNAIGELRNVGAKMNEIAACAIAAAVNVARVSAVTPAPTAGDDDDDDDEVSGDSDLSLIPGLNTGDDFSELAPIDIRSDELTKAIEDEERRQEGDDSNIHGVVVDDDRRKLLEMGRQATSAPALNELLKVMGDAIVNKESPDDIDEKIDRIIGSDRKSRGLADLASVRDTIEEDAYANDIGDAVRKTTAAIASKKTGDGETTDVSAFLSNLFDREDVSEEDDDDDE